MLLVFGLCHVHMQPFIHAYTHTHIMHLTLCWTFPQLCFYFTGQAKVKLGCSHLSRVLRKQVETRELATHTVCLHRLGNTYKYQAGNRMNALLWFKHLSAACQSNRQQVWIHTHTHTNTVEYRLFHKPPPLPRCQPIWCRSNDRWWEGESAKEGGMKKQTRRMRRSIDSIVGAFTAMSPAHQFSSFSPGLTAASPATTALTRLPCVCLCVCTWINESECERVDVDGDYLGCICHWTRTWPLLSSPVCSQCL